MHGIKYIPPHIFLILQGEIALLMNKMIDMIFNLSIPYILFSPLIFLLYHFPLSTIFYFYRAAFLPYKLTPHLIQLKGFDAGSVHFVATISLGTGDHNSQKLLRSTIISVIQRLKYIDQDIHFTLLYSNSWYMPYSKLGTYHTKFDNLCKKILHPRSSR